MNYKHQNSIEPFVIWLTGLSGAGKTTIANLVAQELLSLEHKVYVLDGDCLRSGLNSDLGFSHEDRSENIRRISEVAKILVDAGTITVVSAISPFISDRDRARSLFTDNQFIEIFVDTSLDVCKQRDNKGLYKSALSGEIEDFTGISSPYEAPKNPELVLKTEGKTPQETLFDLMEYLKNVKRL